MVFTCPIASKYFPPLIRTPFLAAAVTLVRRFLGYGFLFGVLGFLTVILNQEPEFAMLVGGPIIALVGVFRLISFVQSHPLHPPQANGA